MSVSINGTSGLVFNDASTQNTAPKVGMVNRIINGAMMIDQRNAGASVTPTSSGYNLDRWYAALNQSSKFSVQQSTTAPSGFKNSLLVTSLSSYSVGATDYFFIKQSIEGFNTSDLGFGAAGSSTVTLSFWVRSSLTGTFGGSLTNGSNNIWYPFSYTISAANTWEQKSVTITGATSGSWNTSNGSGIEVSFGLGVGSTYSGTAGAWNTNAFNPSATGATSVVGTNGATFYITGVQLEKGSTATSFDYRPYGTELMMCERYYQRVSTTGSNQRIVSGVAYSSTEQYFLWSFQQKMRASPTVSIPSLGNVLKEGVAWYSPTSAFIITTAPDFANIGAVLSSSAFSLGEFAWWGRNNSDLILTASAEL